MKILIYIFSLILIILISCTINEQDKIQEKTEISNNQLPSELETVKKNCTLNDQLPSAAELVNNIGRWDKNGAPRYSKPGSSELSPKEFISSARSPEASAICFIKNYPQIFKLNDPENELNAIQVKKDELGFTLVRLQRMFKGLPVSGSQLLIHFNSKGQVKSFNGNYHPSFTLSIDPTLSADEAIKIAKKDYGSRAKEVSAELLIYTNEENYLLTWRVDYSTSETPVAYYIIDAHSGEIIYFDDGIRT